MSAQAGFTYPVNGAYQRLVNVLDTLDVAYHSQWDALNLTLFCLVAPTSSSYAAHNMESNPILANGTFRIYGIAGYKLPINQYPTYCHYKLVEYHNNTNTLVGGTFNLTSTSGAAKTFAYSASSSAAKPTQSATTTGSAYISSGTAQAGAAASPTADSSGNTDDSSGLSTGAKAGIGVGAALGVILVAALLGFFVVRRRRQKRKTVTVPPTQHTGAPIEYFADKPKDSPLPEGQAELPAETKKHTQYSEPIELDSSHPRNDVRAELP